MCGDLRAIFKPISYGDCKENEAAGNLANEEVARQTLSISYEL